MTGTRFEVVDPRSDAAVGAIAAYYAELDERFDAGFDPGAGGAAEAADFEPPKGAFVIATVDGAVVACGGVRTLPAERSEDQPVGELKRMWVHPSTRGKGVGRRLLDELEGHSRRLGHALLRLDTNEALTAAVAMYRAAGYVEIGRYNDNPDATHWFEKRLTPGGAATS